MDVDEEEVEMASSSSGKGDKKRFEVKKVSLLDNAYHCWCPFYTAFLIYFQFIYSGTQLPCGLGVRNASIFSFE